MSEEVSSLRKCVTQKNHISHRNLHVWYTPGKSKSKSGDYKHKHMLRTDAVAPESRRNHLQDYNRTSTSSRHRWGPIVILVLLSSSAVLLFSCRQGGLPKPDTILSSMPQTCTVSFHSLVFRRCWPFHQRGWFGSM
jgi:hypothetical protein